MIWLQRLYSTKTMVVLLVGFGWTLTSDIRAQVPLPLVPDPMQTAPPLSAPPQSPRQMPVIDLPQPTTGAPRPLDISGGQSAGQGPVRGEQNQPGIQPSEPKRPPAFRPFQSPSAKRYTQRQHYPNPLTATPAAVVTQKPIPMPVAQPKLQVQKIGPNTGRIGQQLEYRITVANPNPVALANVVVEDFIPKGTRVAGMNPPGQIGTDNIIWQLAQLEPGARAEFTVLLRPEQPGDLTMRTLAYVRFENRLRAKIQGVPVALQVTAPKSILAGQKGLFKIVIANKSTQTLAGLLLGTDLPAGLHHEAGKNIEAELTPIAPGETKVVDLEIGGQQSGRHTLTFRVAAGKKTLVQSKAEVLVTAVANLQIKMTGPPTISADKAVIYQLNVVNRGTDVAADVVIFHKLPKGMTFIKASDAGVFDQATRVVRWQLKPLSPGHTKAVAVQVKGEGSGQVTMVIEARAPGGVRVGMPATVTVNPTSRLGVRPFGLLPQKR